MAESKSRGTKPEPTPEPKPTPEPEPEPKPTPEPGRKPAADIRADKKPAQVKKAPQTGDRSYALAWGVLLVLSGIGGVVILTKSKTKNR